MKKIKTIGAYNSDKIGTFYGWNMNQKNTEKLIKKVKKIQNKRPGKLGGKRMNKKWDYYTIGFWAKGIDAFKLFNDIFGIALGKKIWIDEAFLNGNPLEAKQIEKIFEYGRKKHEK